MPKSFLERYMAALTAGASGEDAAKQAQSEYDAEAAAEAAQAEAERAAAERAKVDAVAQAEARREAAAQAEVAQLQAAAERLDGEHHRGPLRPLAVLMAEFQKLGGEAEQAAEWAMHSWRNHPEVVKATDDEATK